MAIRLALAGNPNSGKTTLFNALTGSNQFVGNWPGVTVEKKEGKVKGYDDVEIIDLPGVYSLSPYTLEEVVAREFLLNETPDAIINIVDGSNIERNLYLTTQLMELGIPVIIAVNMMDIVAKNGDILDVDKMSDVLGCEVVTITALKSQGVDALVKKAISASKVKKSGVSYRLADSLENAITEVKAMLPKEVKDSQKRFVAIKLLENDKKIAKKLSSVPDVTSIVKDLEKEFNDDIESIITNERYTYITDIITGFYTRKAKQGQMSLSDKIDRVLTNRWAAFPIFAAIMFLVYYIAVTTVGTFVTDFTNDGLFGEGFHLFGSDVWVPGIPVLVENLLDKLHCVEWLKSLVIDGIIAGVGAVLGFVPQMLVLFFMLAFLESCGYMSRVAFIMDRVFRRFGLSGKSFIPMLIGMGCGVPGIMASRTIENDKDRKMTIITTTFIPCGAKMPIIALVASALFGGAWWVAASAYFIGIAAVIVSGIILKKTKLFASDPAPFVMELPAYHMPTFSNLMRSMWERGWSFIKKAGTVILLSTIIIWAGSCFGVVDGKFAFDIEMEMGNSLLGIFGNAVKVVFAPLGFGNATAVIATLMGLVAKEEVVAVLGILDFAQMGKLAAFSFMIFNLLCAPCFAAMGAIKREMNNAKWFWFAIGYQCMFAYVISLIVYQIGGIITGEVTFGVFTIVAIALASFMLFMLFKPKRKINY